MTIARTTGRELRLFVADASGDNWSELTSGDADTVRLAAPDLQRARRARGRLADDVAVILDVTVAVAADFRSARESLASHPTDTLHYVGTVDGLAGLIADIVMANVADGVTLIPASPQQDIQKLAAAVSDRVALRVPLAGAA